MPSKINKTWVRTKAENEKVDQILHALYSFTRQGGARNRVWFMMAYVIKKIIGWKGTPRIGNATHLDQNARVESLQEDLYNLLRLSGGRGHCIKRVHDVNGLSHRLSACFPYVCPDMWRDGNRVALLQTSNCDLALVIGSPKTHNAIFFMWVEGGVDPTTHGMDLDEFLTNNRVPKPHSSDRLNRKAAGVSTIESLPRDTATPKIVKAVVPTQPPPTTRTRELVGLTMGDLFSQIETAVSLVVDQRVQDKESVNLVLRRQLVALAAERDELKKQLDAIRSLFQVAS